MRVLRDPRLWGAATLGIVGVVGLIAAMLYVSPPGNKILTFYTDDASSISPSMTVRIAGITVGKVKDLAIEPKQVRVRATVQADAYVGDESTVQVRMLTVVGGYYINIDSLGRSSLGSRPIPMDRVTLPYSLVRALTDSTKVTAQVNPAPIDESLTQLQQGMTGSNLATISSIVDAGTRITDTLDHQRGQVSAILNLSDEYVAQLANYREPLQQMVDKIAILEQTLMVYGKGMAGAALGLGDVIQHLTGVGVWYEQHRDQVISKLVHWKQIAQTWADRTGLIVRILRRTRDRMTQTLETQNAPPELLATDLCIPVPGSPC